MITKKDLEEMKPGIFAQGYVLDNPDGVNVANTDERIKWVACRGDVPDWVIYVDNPYSPQPDHLMVADYGDKIHNDNHIKKLVECDEEAYKMYRH